MSRGEDSVIPQVAPRMKGFGARRMPVVRVLSSSFFFFNRSIVNIQYYVSFRCTKQQVTIFKDHILFIVIIKLAKYPVLYNMYPLLSYPYITPVTTSMFSMSLLLFS